jgi:co-chaperonin GroES (HSP10)
MIKVFSSNVLIEMDIASERINGIIVLSKTKRKRNFGRVVQDSPQFKKGDRVLFFAEQGIIMDGKCLIPEKFVSLIFKKNKMLIKGNRVLVEAEEISGVTEGGVIVPEMVTKQLQPIGKILEIGEDVMGYHVGDRVIFDKDRAMSLIQYNLPGYKDKPIFFVRDEDILAIL